MRDIPVTGLFWTPEAFDGGNLSMVSTLSNDNINDLLRSHPGSTHITIEHTPSEATEL